MNFDQLLKFCVDQKASDIHLQAGSLPMLRLGRHLRGIEGQTLPDDELRTFLTHISQATVGNDLDAAMNRGAVFLHEVPGLARFRCQLSSHLGAPSATLRVIASQPPSLESLNLPPIVKELTLPRRGVVLVSGEAGSGRTTTLATLVDAINSNTVCKIVTIENPVEYRHPNKKAIVTQHTAGRDVPSMAEGLRQVFREDADVVALGELQDSESVRLALRLAESGRQVLAVCEGGTAIQTLERLQHLVPTAEQRDTTRQLAATLEAIIGLRMATTKDGGRRPVVEILRGGPYIARSITEGRMADLATLITGRQAGMQTFDQHLAELYQAGQLSGTEALRLATNSEAVATVLRGARG